MTARLRTSRAGLELIKSFEGFRDAAIRLPDGRWMIGYGHVRTAREGLKISQNDAEELLIYDLKPVEDAIHAMVYAPLNQNQFDALASLGFNISPGRLRDSGVIHNLNSGNYLGASSDFDIWRKARIGGRLMVVDALVRRRAAEKAMFMEHPEGRPSAPTPLVTPEADIDGGEAGMASHTPTDTAASPAAANPAPSIDMAEAVRRLAERTQGAVSPTEQVAPVIQAPDEAETETYPHTPPRTPGEIEQAQRVVAERLARILDRAERSAEERQPPRPAAQPARAAAAKPERIVREMPAENRSSRAFIDDTETFNPGRDPAALFAEAERNAKIVSRRALNMGIFNGRTAVLLPWIFILVLSLVGFGIGLVDTFGDTDVGSIGIQGASTVLAVFGMMILMSVYFIVTRASSDSDA
jgi:lysozyme